MRWRGKLAEVAGYPPLMLMESYFDPKEWWFMYGGTMDYLQNAQRGPSAPLGWSYTIKTIFDALPIPWDHFQNDPLTKLLHHSDCGGDIAWEDCGPLADRLTELLPRLPEEEDGGHIGNWRAKTQTFINGLRRASQDQENVEFH
jgi:hypothetical protein